MLLILPGAFCALERAGHGGELVTVPCCKGLLGIMSRSTPTPERAQGP